MGNWEVSDLEVGFAQAGIVILDNGSRMTGIRIRGCVVHEIHGAGMFQYPHMHHSTAIVLRSSADEPSSWMIDVVLDDVTVFSADAGVSIWGARQLQVTGLKTRYTGRGAGIDLFRVYDGLIKDSKIEYAGLHGMFWGTAGIGLSQSHEIIIEDTEVAHTQNPAGSPDGVGIDIEGSKNGVVLKRVLLHHNQGAAILVFRNPDWGRDNQNISLFDSRFEYNGLSNPLVVPALMRHYHNNQAWLQISGNHVQLAHPQQPLNTVDETPTEQWPSSASTWQNQVRY